MAPFHITEPLTLERTRAPVALPYQQLLETGKARVRMYRLSEVTAWRGRLRAGRRPLR